MATIKKTSEQVHALREIRDGLKSLDTINTLLSGGADDLTITFTKENRKRKLEISEKNIRQLFLRLQKRNASEIRALAEAHNIDLSDKDKEILITAEGILNSGAAVSREGAYSA